MHYAMNFVTRFAPTPSGYLHLGHAFSAWTAWRTACDNDGRFLLRLEDIDTIRSKREFEPVMFDDLIWLGIDWELPVRRQSEHFDEYAAVLERLRALGLVYRCFKTRTEILEDIARAPHGVGEVYRGPDLAMSADEEAARLAADQPYAWRLSLDRCRDHLGPRFAAMRFVEDGVSTTRREGAREMVADPAPLGDVVLGRKDVGTSYHIAVVHDDALQGVSHVIRGEDLLALTPLHVLLQTLLGLPTPIYRHHRLLLDETGKRFAKRDQAATLQAMRESGETSEGLRSIFLR
jgi:glutamyl-Q tRNA(Asp) synthetase